MPNNIATLGPTREAQMDELEQAYRHDDLSEFIQTHNKLRTSKAALTDAEIVSELEARGIDLQNIEDFIDMGENPTGEDDHDDTNHVSWAETLDELEAHEIARGAVEPINHLAA